MDIDKKFSNLLTDQLRENATQFLTSRRISTALRSFEDSIKYNFDPYPDCEAEYEIPMGPGMPDLPEIGLEAGCLRLTR
jgi:hypothetical protein